MQQTVHKIVKLTTYGLLAAVAFIVSFFVGGLHGSSHSGISALTEGISAHADVVVGSSGTSDSGSGGCGDGGSGGSGGSSDAGGGADGSGCGSTGDSY